ncbi:MAG TPA: nuclear transport factor 2 family protein [Acetobacteraceae bacterium]|nr:nuclear transport factor 2 family protein [Acetobacteraceae bacterium]
MSTEDIKAREDQRFAALLAGDIDALAPLLHRDLRYVHSSGDIENRDAYLAELRAGASSYLEARRSNEKIVVHGETAMVFNQLDMSVIHLGQPRQVHSAALAVWVLEQGSWQLIALQSTALKPSDA